MGVQSAGDPARFAVIHLGGEAAALVPLGELRRLLAVEAHVPADVLEAAEVEATVAAHDEWVTTGRAGARSHDDVMAELLTGR